MNRLHDVLISLNRRHAGYESTAKVMMFRIVSTQEMNQLKNVSIWLDRKTTGNESTANIFILKNS